MSFQSLKHKSVKSAQWSLIGTIVNAFMQIAVMVVMARLVSPREFGVLAMAQLFIRFATYFANFGIVPALLRKKELSKEDIRAGFGASLVTFLLMAIVMFLLAPFSRALLDEEEIAWVVRILAINFFIMGMGVVSQALLQRDMRFKYLSGTQVISYFLGYSLIGIPLAWLGWGVWALVASMVARSLILVCLQYMAVRHPLVPSQVWKEYREILSFGGQHSLAGFITFMSNSVDVFVIGKFMGGNVLGVYTRSVNLLNLPMQFLSQSVLKVSFPGFSRLQDDPDRVRSYYLRAVMMLALITFPVGIGFLPIAREIIGVVFGARWVAGWPGFVAYGVVMPLCLLSALSWTANDVKGSVSRKLVWQVVAFLFLISAVAIGIRFGLLGVACAMLVGQLVKSWIAFGVCRKVLGFTWLEFLSSISSGLAIAFELLLITFIFNSFLPVLSPLLRLLGVLAGSIVALFILVLKTRPTGVRYLAGMILEVYPVLCGIPLLGVLLMYLEGAAVEKQVV